MARNDFRIVVQSEAPTWAPLTAAANFDEGEPVALTTGAVLEASDDPASVYGIAAERSTDRLGLVKTSGTPITVYRLTPDNIFESHNYAEDGAGTAATPAASDIGNMAGFTLTGGNWFVDVGTANTLVEIIDVLSRDGISLAHPHNTGVAGRRVLFRAL